MLLREMLKLTPQERSEKSARFMELAYECAPRVNGCARRTSGMKTDLGKVIQTLNEGKIEFIVIGGLAGMEERRN